jgi:Holliday junction resolvase RusA-like endonuclease
MEFTLHLPPPPTHQAALRILKTRDGRQFVGKMASSKAAKWGKAATLLLKAEVARQDHKTIEGVCYVRVNFYYSHTKDSKRVADREKLQFIEKATRPDLDNLAKGVLDCMVGAGVLKDDGQIARLTLSKYYSDTEMVTIDITHKEWDT